MPTTLYGQYKRQTPFYQLRKTFREDILTTLNSEGSRWVSLIGPRWMGKTAEAAAIVASEITKENFKIIVWLNAENIEQDKTNIESALHLEAGQLFDHLLRYDEGPWLLIFDNVALSALSTIPSIGKNGHILVTSREEGWPAAIRMSNFTPEESVTLFSQVLGHLDDTTLVRKIIGASDRMNNIPGAVAALAQATTSTQMTPLEYLNCFFNNYSNIYPTQLPPDPLWEEIRTLLSRWRDVANPASPETKAMVLLNYLTHLYPAFIPREFILELTICSLTATDCDIALQLLIREGLIEKAAPKHDCYFISAPIMFALRVFYLQVVAENDRAVYLGPYFRSVLKTLNEKLSSASDESTMRFYYMHVFELLIRVLGISRVSGDQVMSFSKRIENFSEMNAIADHLLKQKLDYALAPNENQRGPSSFGLLTLLTLTLTFIEKISSDDNIDVAKFFSEIVFILLKRIVPNIELTPDHSEEISETNWNQYSTEYELYARLLNLKSALQARGGLIYNPALYREACGYAKNQFQLFNKILSRRRLDPHDEKRRHSDNLKILTIILWWNYSWQKSIPFQDTRGIGAMRAHENLEHYLTYDPTTKKFTLNGIYELPLSPPITLELQEKKDRKHILTYYTHLAAIEKKKIKQWYYAFHRSKILRAAVDTLGQTLVFDVLDKKDRDICYGFDKLMNLLLAYYDPRNEQYSDIPSFPTLDSLKKKCTDLKNKIISVRQDMIDEPVETLSQNEIKVQLQEVIADFSAILREVSIQERPGNAQNPDESPKKVFTSAIRILEHGYKIYKESDGETVNYSVVYYFKKIGKYELQNYRAIRENGLTGRQGKKYREAALKKSTAYFKKALRKSQKHYHRDQPLLETVSIFVSLLELAYWYRVEKMPWDNIWNRDKLVDYFIRCRLLLSQLFDATWHYARKLFDFAEKLQLTPQLVQSSRLKTVSIFDITLSASFDYYQNLLRGVEQELKADPSITWLRYQRAYLMINTGMFIEAIRELDLFLKFYPYSSLGNALKAYAEIRLGRYSEAFVHALFAQSLHGNSDSLIKRWLQDAEQQLKIRACGVSNTVIPTSKEGLFLGRLTNYFAMLLQNQIELSTGKDKRWSPTEARLRLLQAVSKMIPESLSAMGLSTKIPIGEAISDVAGLAVERYQLQIKYRADKVAETSLKPAEINNSPVFKNACLTLLSIFHFTISCLNQRGVTSFAKYLVKSMVAYLGSDRLVAFYELETQLVTGATEGTLTSHRWLRNEPYQNLYTEHPRSRRWRAQAIVKDAFIATPNGLWFKPPTASLNPRPWEAFVVLMPQYRTEEEARMMGCEEIPFKDVPEAAAACFDYR